MKRYFAYHRLPTTVSISRRHTGVVYTTAISPDGSLCASGGKDGIAMLWDVNDGKHLYSLDASGTINALSFSPKNYWLVAATDTSKDAHIRMHR